ncbi:UNVERIFIED_ORG: hypothetical protein GGE11_003255 [Mycolicibacterium obuense]
MQARATLNLVKQTARTLGTELPSEISDAVTAAERLVTAAEGIPRADLTGAVLDALAEGRDYHADKALLRRLIDGVLVSQGIVPAARGRGEDGIEAALVECTDQILGSWSKAIEPHSAALTKAAEVLPDLDNVEAVKKAGVEAMHHWANAQYGVKMWRAAVQGFRQIAGTARITAPDARLVMTDADPPGNLPADPWVLARNGIPLSLPSSISEYQQRVANQAQRRTEQAAPAEEAAPI